MVMSPDDFATATMVSFDLWANEDVASDGAESLSHLFGRLGQSNLSGSAASRQLRQSTTTAGSRRRHHPYAEAADPKDGKVACTILASLNKTP